MFQAVPLPIIRSTKLTYSHSVRYCQTNPAAIVDETELCSISSTISASSSIGLTLPDAVYVQFRAPDDGRRNRLKHVQ